MFLTDCNFDPAHKLRPTDWLLFPSVSEEGGSGLHSPTDLYHRVPVLPAGGRTVLQLFPLPETGETHCCLLHCSALQVVTFQKEIALLWHP